MMPVEVGHDIFFPMDRSRAALTFGILDLLFAGFYVFLFIWVIPSRSALFTSLAMLISTLLAAGGIGMMLRARWGKVLATIASVTMLVACILLILLLVASAAYLHGIYGGVGQAGAALGLIAAALVFQAVGLLPILQLAHLRRVKKRIAGGDR